MTMEKELQKAYDYLTPKDQLIVNAMIIALYEKDQQIRNCTIEINKLLTDSTKKG